MTHDGWVMLSMLVLMFALLSREKLKNWLPSIGTTAGATAKEDSLLCP